MDRRNRDPTGGPGTTMVQVTFSDSEVLVVTMDDTPEARTLPEFGAPPLHEVALTAHYEPVAWLSSLELAPLLTTWQSDYPRVEE